MTNGSLLSDRLMVGGACVTDSQTPYLTVIVQAQPVFPVKLDNIGPPYHIEAVPYPPPLANLHARRNRTAARRARRPPRAFRLTTIHPEIPIVFQAV